MGTKLVISESVVCADLDGEAVLLDVESGVYFGLNTLGTEIWKLIEQGAGEEEIAARLHDTYEVEADRLRADIATFLDQLMAKALVRVADGSE